MKRMNNFLDRITIGQIATVTSLSWLVDWIISNEIITLLTFFTLMLSMILAIRKFLMYVKKDSIYGIQIIISWLKDRRSQKEKEVEKENDK